MITAQDSQTWHEIHAQPAIWRDWGQQLNLAEQRRQITASGAGEIWLCGAGSSAYVGEILAAALEGAPGPRIRAVATTDIVARPHDYLRGPARLVVSFGRSGNSAESIGLIEAMEALVPDWPRLNVTCNGASALARRPGARVIVLPEATHDAGFAMTSSFSTMYLTMLAILDQRLAPADLPDRMGQLARALERRLPGLAREAQDCALPGRAVFVGSGALGFAAREAALKVMELTAGEVPALWDTTLGFRHGPKSFVQAGTRIWILASADRHCRAYDADLAEELALQFPDCPLTLLDPAEPGLEDAWRAPLMVAEAQVHAAVWSARLGCQVDDPFAGRGTLTRVVSGVRLHPVVRR